MLISDRKILEKLLKGNKFEPEDLDIFPHATMLISHNRIILAANKSAQDIGVMNGSHCWDSYGQCEAIPAADKRYYRIHKTPPTGSTMCSFCMAKLALSSQQEQNTKVAFGETVWDTFWVPVDENSYLHFGIPVSNDDT